MPQLDLIDIAGLEDEQCAASIIKYVSEMQFKIRPLVVINLTQGTAE